MLGTTPQAVPSPLVLIVLLVILGASCAVFWLLGRQWTSRRQWMEMLEWARGNGYTLRENPADETPPILRVLPQDARIRLLLEREATVLVQASTSPTPAGQKPEQPNGWHLLISELDTDWPPTGLRPAAHRASLLDLYRLSSYPSLIPPERFIVFGTGGPTARALADSPVRALLPADIGLLLHGHNLVLDFTSRPFDPIELERMTVLANQLRANLPPPK